MQLVIDVAGPQLAGPLTLFPIHSAAPSAPQYLCGPEAETLGSVIIHEADEGARVPELVIENQADRPVLLIEGEALLGTQQNRTLNVSVLFPPSVAVTVPVSCVEAGRWDAPKPGARSRHHAPSGLRGRKTASVLASMRSGRGRVSDQAQVWADVEDYSHRVGAESATRALEDAHVDVQQEASQLLGDVRPLDGQRGVIAAIGGRVLSLDLFDKPSSLAHYWDGLLAGYALEAMHAPDLPVRLADAKAFAAAVATAGSQGGPAVGLGREVRLTAPGVIGLGLEWSDAVVHLAAFAVDDPPVDARPIRRGRRA